MPNVFRLLLLLTLGLSSQGVAQRAPSLQPELTAPVTVPLKQIDGGRPTIEVMVNGHGPFLFGIETGSQYGVAMTERLADAAEVGSRPNGVGRVIDSLRIGGLVFRNVGTSLHERAPVPGIEGMLGIEAFRHLQMTISYATSTVRFSLDTLPAVDGIRVHPLTPFVPGGALVTVGANVGGRQLPAMVDTQGGGTPLLCRDALADSLALQRAPVITGQAQVGGAAAPARPISAARLSGNVQVGRAEATEPIVTFLPLPSVLHCLLGVDFIRRFETSMDLRTMRIRFSGPSSIDADAGLKSYGFVPRLDSAGVMRVMWLLPSGSAESAGLRVGDEVQTVNGASATDRALSGGVMRVLAASDAVLELRVVRDGRLRGITVRPTLLVP